MSDIRFTLSAEEQEAIAAVRDAARAFRETGGAVDDTSARLKAYHNELSATSKALGGISGDLKGLRSDIGLLSENLLKMQETQRGGSERLKKSSGEAEAAAKALAETQAAAARRQIESSTGIDRARQREREKTEEVASSVRKLSEDERALQKHMEMQAGAGEKVVRVGTEYYRVTHDQAEAMQLLAKTHRSSQLAHEKTAEDLDRLKKAYTAGLVPLDQFTEAEARLTSKLEDQTKRWEANKGRSLSMLKDEMENAIRTMVPFGNHIVNIGQRFTSISNIAKEHGGEIRDIAREYAESGKSLKMVDGAATAAASGGLRSLLGSFSFLLHPITLTVVGLAALTAGLAVAGVHAAPFVHDMKELENTLGLVGNQTAVARAQMENLNAKALSGASMGVGPREAAKAMQELASLGLNANDTLKAFEPVALLAKARSLDMATAAKIAGAQMAIFGTDVDHLGVELDKLSIISNMTGVQAQDLQMMMAKAGKGAIAAGQDFNSIAIAAGLARNAGIAMEEVMSGLGSGLLQVASKGRAAFTALTGGKDVVDSVTGKFRPLEAILMDVTEATRGMSDADKAARIEKIFGRESLTAILPVMQQLTNGIKDQSGKLLQGADAARYMREQLDAAGGANKRFAENLQDSLQGQQERFRALIDAIETGIGQRIEPALKSLYSVANAVLEVMNDIFSPAQQKDPLRERFDYLTAKAAELQKEVERINAMPYGQRSHHAAQIAFYETTLKQLKEVREQMAGQNADATKTGAASTEAAAAAAELTKKEGEALRDLRNDIDQLNAASLAGRKKIEAERAAAVAHIQRDVEKAREAGMKNAEVYTAFKEKIAATNRKYDAEIVKLSEESGKKWADQMARVREETQKLVRDGLEPLARAEHDRQAATDKANAEYEKGLFGKKGSTEAQIALHVRLEAIEKVYTKTVEEEAKKREEAIKKETEAREKAEADAIKKAIEAERQLAHARKTFQDLTQSARLSGLSGYDKALAQINARAIADAQKVQEAFNAVTAAEGKTPGGGGGSIDGTSAEDAANAQTKKNWQDTQDALTAIQKRAAMDRAQLIMQEAGKWMSIGAQGLSAFQKLNDIAMKKHEKAVERLNDRIAKDEEELAQLRKKIADGTASHTDKMHVKSLEARIAASDAARKKEKAEAVKQFHFGQLLSISQAIIAGGLAAMQAIAQFGPPPSPMGIAGLAAATLITGAEVAVIANQDPPALHAGGVARAQDRGTANVITMPAGPRLQPDEIPYTMLEGEGAANRRGMRALGEDGLSRLNRLGELPDQLIEVAFQLGHKTLDQVAYRSTRSGGGPYHKVVRRVTGARSGHRSRR